MESRRFEADVRQILHLVTHSLYSEREIFLRELISNGNDAINRARIESLKNDKLLACEGEPSIHITVDEEASTITITDDGIGMTSEQAVEHLGTIAHSGTAAFAKALEGGDSDGLIGQFGVGFYSAFMVADKVVVDTLSAHPDSKAVCWISDGGDQYEIEESTRTTRGTAITLHLKEDAVEFCDEDTLKEIVTKHSNYVGCPVMFSDERANSEQALWTMDKKELKEEDYNDFYKSKFHDWQEALAYSHTNVEGLATFSAVMFVPAKRPFELDHMDAKVSVELYQKRVKILDNADALLPRYLRFMRGVVDSPDIDLNMSREILQQTPAVKFIKKQLTKRILKQFTTMAADEPEKWATLWGEYGHILKEGVTESDSHFDALVDLLRYKTTTSNGEFRSLAQVKEDMAEGQEAIWFYSSLQQDRIAEAPVLEGFKKREWEVILMSDPVDEWVAMRVQDYKETPIKSVMSGDLDDISEESEETKAAKESSTPMVTWLGELLGEDVAEVRISSRLTESPSVLVDKEGGLGSNITRILKATNQEMAASERVLEINPEHPIVVNLVKLHAQQSEGIEPFGRLLLDHATISEGRLEDPQGFAGRLQILMERAAAGIANTPAQ